MNQALEKQKIRIKVRGKRDLLNEKEIHELSEKILKKLEERPEFKAAANILLYYPTLNEVQTTPLLLKYIGEKNIHLPRIEKEWRLSARLIKDLKILEKGEFNIPTPSVDASVTAINKLDLVIVPGLAFDRKGERIGYGMGYYDTLLKECHCPKIALAYDFQIVENVPGQEHDETVDLIITPTSVLEISHNS